jgi:hypothetical protein
MKVLVVSQHRTRLGRACCCAHCGVPRDTVSDVPFVSQQQQQLQHLQGLPVGVKCTALNSEAERQKKAKLYEEYVTEEKVCCPLVLRILHCTQYVLSVRVPVMAAPCIWLGYVCVLLTQLLACSK